MRVCEEIHSGMTTANQVGERLVEPTNRGDISSMSTPPTVAGAGVTEGS